MAELTPGFAGADIDNLCNEAALHAARKRKKAVEAEDFATAVDRVIGGLENKNKLISPEEKERIAYHETGHAICGWYFEHADPLLKISIVPRGAAALGFTQYLPKERYLHTRKQLLDTLSMTLGGRAAEEVIYNDVSTGAQNDLERVTQTVYAMIGRFGMGLETGMFSFKELDNEYALKQPYSEETARAIDKEARKIIDEAYERALALLKKHKDKLEEVTKVLMENEVLYREDFEKLIGEEPANKS